MTSLSFYAGIHDHIEDIIKNEQNDQCMHVLQEDNEQLVFGAEKFISRYNKLKHSLPLLTSALHRFGWTYGGSVKSRKGGNLRHGRRIAVQATAAGRRRKDLSRGKARVTPGKPLGLLKGQPPAKKPLANDSRYVLPTRREPKGKRKHSLKLSIEKGHQNAGKW